MSILELGWATVHQYGDAWFKHHQLRHKVFINRMNWDVPSAEGCEYDQYDTPASRYLLWVDHDQEVRGAVRLMPTTVPYMARDMWPEMFVGEPPNSDDIWEITRFCCDQDLEPDKRARVVTGIVEAIQIFGLKRKISNYVAVMPLSMFRMSIKPTGCAYELIGPKLSIDGRPTGAARIPVSAKNRQRIRAVALAHEIRARSRGHDPDKVPA